MQRHFSLKRMKKIALAHYEAKSYLIIFRMIIVHVSYTYFHIYIRTILITIWEIMVKTVAGILNLSDFCRGLKIFAIILRYFPKI
jgi:hypothetical protein